MIDIKLLRMELASAHENLAKRGYKLDMILFNTLEEQRKRNQIDLEQCKGEKKLLSQQFGREASQGNDTTPLKVKIEALDARMNKIDEVLSTVQVELADLMSGIPNLIHTSVPTGKTESDNVVIREWGTPKAMDHPKDHIELGERMGGMDIDTAAKLSGARFSLLKNDIAKLHRALIQFMLDLHTDEHGYEEVYCPYLVQGRPLYGTGQLPKFSEDLYKIEGHDLYLIPTGEVPLTNIVSDRVLEEAELPLKLVVHTPCFRSEAGSYGRDTRGLIRQHQFDKVELVQIVHPERSYEALEELTGHAEIVLKKLDLPYRVVNLCSADIGFSAAKTYDLEVWLPSQNTYREISSCSNCEAFQARRMSARYKDLKTQKNHLIHTLNGSALAVGRTLIAVMENYQNPNGSIAIPVVLRPYMNDREQIG
jgi:seryl-tRNA synthetase